MESSEADDTAITVKELIDLLATYPVDLRVVVDGYEDGYDNVHPHNLSIISIKPKKDARWWEGENEHAGRDPSEHDFSALCIARGHGDFDD